ncbi:hypothetical protein [Burkholderia ubonensis]|uniref:hypothetical protein n=1 Tax=Burkholderia ubonensis TaxID=101571 RepID=UPI0018DF8264|nr:hypothetical protein [Burkholderia ubonensis]
MASITKRGPYQYQAQVRRKDYPAQSKTFETMKAAREWATAVAAEMNGGTFVDWSELERTTFSGCPGCPFTSTHLHLYRPT